MKKLNMMQAADGLAMTIQDNESSYVQQQTHVCNGTQQVVSTILTHPSHY
jgi:hypothetical protein